MILLIYLNVGYSIHSRLREGLFQSKDLSELFVVTRIIFGQTDVANVKLHTFLLQVIGLDTFAGRASAETSKNLCPSSEAEKSMNSLPTFGWGAVVDESFSPLAFASIVSLS
jgi:hypothetical protein